MRIGFVGLGRMGANVVHRLACDCRRATVAAQGLESGDAGASGAIRGVQVEPCLTLGAAATP